jgi:hydroxymethylpyrimidine pyrophosphatase-like HAD family hydrolase
MTRSPWCRAIAIDYDGTLAGGRRPDDSVLDRLLSWRREGGRLVLVTGRILDHLLEDFDEVTDAFDLVVAENGAVLSDGRRNRLLAPAVDIALWEALHSRGVPCRPGSVILATHSEYSLEIEATIGALGLDVQLVPNRAELMIVPAGVSKGTGLRVALRTLGLSPHSALAIGDGENDLSMLQSCEIGAAVANAVPALRHAADVVTDAPDGQGVHELLDGPLLRGHASVASPRWTVELGRDPHGAMVTIPASQTDVLVCGKSGGGKSYIAGLIAEQLIELDYSLFIVDPEGDHNALTRLPGVVAVGTRERIPTVDHLVALLQQHLGTVSVDLSLQPDRVREDFYRRVPAAIEQLQRTRGVPHWIMLDEAHTPLRSERAMKALIEAERKSHLLVTFDPGLLPETLIDRMDVAVVIPHTPHIAPVLRSFGCAQKRFEGLAEGARIGDAVVLRRASLDHLAEVVRVRIATRRTDHVRHLHKYTAGQLPESRRFYFRNALDQPVGRPAGNMAEFHTQIAHCDPSVIDHHARHGDFSRWIATTLGDRDTASAVEAIEQSLTLRDSATPDASQARVEILAAIERRYGDKDAPGAPASA